MSTCVELTTAENRQIVFNIRNIESIFEHPSKNSVTCIQNVSGEIWNVLGDLNSILSKIPEGSW